MAHQSSRGNLYRLLIAGAIILISFPLGMFVYVNRTRSMPAPVQLKDLSAAIKTAAGHDTALLIGDRKFIIKKGQINAWTESYTRAYTGQKETRFSAALDKYVAGLANNVAASPRDARFTLDETGTVTIIAPAQDGLALDAVRAGLELRRGLLANLTEIPLTAEISPAAVTADKIRALGITSRLAVGESNFAGSSPARVQNIKVSSKKYNGFIVLADEAFSFNAILGDVVASTGYAPEKVIKNNKLEYEYGGGICQVSTTLFRAAIAAGFPILERRSHAFPVGYYAPHGFDATIYPGSSDMRFRNNTGHAVLIQTRTVGTKIYFELYGTNDGRTVAIDGPYQYDIAEDGSMKAYFTRVITNPDGTVKTERFNSTYKSPKLYPTEPNPYI